MTIINKTYKGNPGALKAELNQNGELIEGSIALRAGQSFYGKDQLAINKMIAKFRRWIKRGVYFKMEEEL
jgi:hypothetical protein